MINRSIQHWPATMTETLDVCPTCPTCGRLMLDGEPVTMSWNGVPMSHINCSQILVDTK